MDVHLKQFFLLKILFTEIIICKGMHLTGFSFKCYEAVSLPNIFTLALQNFN